MPKVKINDVEVEVPAGTNVIEAAKLAGVEIPHYCYHPHLSIAGNCRMCMCETDTPRGPMLEIACNMTAREGLVVRTETDKVKAVRKSVMEFLLVNHPLDCPICDQSGECRLQDYYMDHGAYDSRGVENKVSKHKRQDIGEHIVLDAERCVQCSRCVRFGDEVTGTGELRLMNRSDHTEIGMFPGERLKHNYQGNLADICPVGALTSKDFRFQRRVWYLREAESVCTGCSTGCNITVCHQEGAVFRYLPRRNDAVNKSWMCDQGRARHTDVSGLRRVLHATVDGQKVAVEAALSEVARRVRAAGPGRVGVVFGTQATNEANWALASLVKAHLPGARLYRVEGNDAGAIVETDALLLDADKNPNALGVSLIADHVGGVGTNDALLAAVAELSLLIVLEDDIVTRLAGIALPKMVVLSTWRSPTALAASIVVPVSHSVEQDGSYTNKSGRVQRVRRAVNPMGDATPAYQVLDKLGANLGSPLGTSMPAATFMALARVIPRMKGMDFKGLGTGGMALAPAHAPAAPAPATSAEAK